MQYLLQYLVFLLSLSAYITIIQFIASLWTPRPALIANNFEQMKRAPSYIGVVDEVLNLLARRVFFIHYLMTNNSTTILNLLSEPKYDMDIILSFLE